MAAPTASFRSLTDVRTFTRLQLALAGTGQAIIKLYDNIVIASDITIPVYHTIDFGRYKFIQGGTSVVTFNGTALADRQQIFSGFVSGKILGPFNNTEVFPEWWGLDDGITSAATTGKHELAINCAIASRVYASRGQRITLAPRIYYTSGVVDMRCSLSLLEGAGSGGSEIRSTPAWTATWQDVDLWLWGIAASNHSGMVLFGSVEPSVQAFRSGISNLTIDAYEASKANPTKRISGITGFGSVEEISNISRVVIKYFSGFGIGFHSTATDDNPQGISILNGLTIEKCWITGSTKRDAIPIYISPHAYQCAVRDSTIDCSLIRANSASAIDPPAYVFDWPIFGMVVSGCVSISNMHLEGMQVGIGVVEDTVHFGTISNVRISGINGNHLMRTTMVYYDEPLAGYTTAPLAAPTLARGDPLGAYSALLSIRRTAADHQNVKDSVVADQIISINQIDYLVHDPVYGVLQSTFGQNASPQSQTGSVKRYWRSNIHGPPTGTGTTGSPYVAGAQYVYPGSILTDREYFNVDV